MIIIKVFTVSLIQTELSPKFYTNYLKFVHDFIIDISQESSLLREEYLQKIRCFCFQLSIDDMIL